MAMSLEYTDVTILAEKLENANRNLVEAGNRIADLERQLGNAQSAIASQRASLEFLKREAEIATTRQAETDRWLRLLEFAMRAL